MFNWEVKAVEPRRDFTLLITFAKGERKVFDCKKHLFNEALPFIDRLRDVGFFMGARADCATVVWSDDVDIAPEYLYDNSESVI